MGFDFEQTRCDRETKTDFPPQIRAGLGKQDGDELYK